MYIQENKATISNSVFGEWIGYIKNESILKI